MDIAKLLTEINERIAQVESLLDRGQVTPDDLLADMKELRGLTGNLEGLTADTLAPHQQALLNLNVQLNSLQAKMGRARDGLGTAIVDIDKRRKALHNYSATTKKKN